MVVFAAAEAEYAGETCSRAHSSDDFSRSETVTSSTRHGTFRMTAGVSPPCHACSEQDKQHHSERHAMNRIAKWLLGLVGLPFVAALAGFAWFVLWPAHTIPPLEKVDRYVWLAQGWG